MDSHSQAIIRRYLDASNVPYALLIDGEWGSGKSWYFKNQFTKDFSDRVPVYTSVNGINTLDQLTNQLFLKRPPLKASKIKDTVVALTKKTVDWIAKEKIGLNVNLDLSGLIQFNLEKDVLIIDDCERLDPSISISALLGYISRNFTEKENIKVILIADEKRLIQKSKSLTEDDNSFEYKIIKEKTIWQTIEFKTDIPDIFENITGNGSKITKQFLLHKKNLLLTLFQDYKINNLRWILYYFQCIDELCKSKIFMNSQYQDIILNSLLIITKEYKESNLTEREEQDIPAHIQSSGDAIIVSDWKKNNAIYLSFGNEDYHANLNKEPEEDGGDVKIDQGTFLMNRFYSYTKNSLNIKYRYFKSIYELVCFGYLNQNLLESELIAYDNSIIKIDEWSKIIDKLIGIDNLEESEFNTLWEQLMKYLQATKLDLVDLENLVGLYEIWSNLGINFNIAKVDFYQIINTELSKCTTINQYRDNIYHYATEDMANNSNEYKNFIEQVDLRRFAILSDLNQETNNKTLDSILNNGEIIDKNNFIMLITYGSDEQIIKLSVWLSSKVSHMKQLSKIFIDEKHRIKMEIKTGRKANFVTLLDKIKQSINTGGAKWYHYQIVEQIVSTSIKNDLN